MSDQSHWQVIQEQRDGDARLSGGVHGLDVEEMTTVPLTLGQGGPQVGTAVLHPGGFLTADVHDPETANKIAAPGGLNKFSLGVPLSVGEPIKLFEV